MKLLLVSHTYLRRELGASKVLIELAEEMEKLRWACRLVSLPELAAERPNEGKRYGDVLREYLHRHAADYDVVDYEHGYLPYPRSELPAKTLLVARAVLLAHHFGEVKIPATRTLKSAVRALVYGRRDRRQRDERIERSHRCLVEADLVNVANSGDQEILVRSGIPREKIVVIPYGLSRSQRSLFDKVSVTEPRASVVSFVGTFDERKGASDLPRIVAGISRSLPEATFRLLGTQKSKGEVLQAFPAALRGRIDVVPSYPAESLPELLAPCSAGVFPSYLEGFGFGVLEMLAAGVPVIAYQVPGPPMMLPSEYLVPAGDTSAMSRKVIDLLRNPEVPARRAWARERSRDFFWPDIAKRTSGVYREHWQRRQ